VDLGLFFEESFFLSIQIFKIFVAILPNAIENGSC